jgi:hypothetical protein
MLKWHYPCQLRNKTIPNRFQSMYYIFFIMLPNQLMPIRNALLGTFNDAKLNYYPDVNMNTDTKNLNTN